MTLYQAQQTDFCRWQNDKATIAWKWKGLLYLLIRGEAISVS